MGKFTHLTIFLALSISTTLHAQQSDTFAIRNDGIDAMRNAIMGDTLSNGERAHPNRIYVLKRGQRYVNTSAIIMKGYHLRVEGEPARTSDEDPGPAVVQFAPDSSDRYDTDRILDVHGDATIKNIWFLGWVSNGHQIWEPIIEESDSAHLMIDHCLFEWTQGPAVHVIGKWTTIYLTNSMIRNAIYANEWWAGRVIYYTAPADSLIEINNTVENVGFGLVQSQGIGLNYFFCDHNTVVNCAKFCFLESYYRKACIANNLFVNCHFTGERMQDRTRQDPDMLLFGQTLNLDTLMTEARQLTSAEAMKQYGTSAVILVGGKTLRPNDPRELHRTVVYGNNASYFDTTIFYPFYRLYNDTVQSKSGMILPEPVMNDRTISMFKWHPHMVYDGSVDNEDPMFVKMLDNLPAILSFLTDRYSANPRNNILWGYDPDSLKDPEAQMCGQNLTLVYSNSSNGVYPTPEDFSYSNSKVLSAGINNFPVGDLNWFPKELAMWNVELDTHVLNRLATGETKLH